ncbi:MAG: caspase family protein [Prevotella sp.]|nr:caspase family protein [Prevotella sp.]
MKKILCLFSCLLFTIVVFAQEKTMQVINSSRNDIEIVYDKANELIENEKYNEGIALVKPYAERGDAISQNYLGLFYESMNENEKGLNWYIKAAENGFANAQFNVGRMYDYRYGSKKGLMQNDDYAKKYYIMSINNENHQTGSKYSVINLFIIYESEKDSASMKKVLEQSVKEGVEMQQAPFLLASKFYKNDSKRAYGLFRISAENGFDRAQYHIGKYFEDGIIVERDMGEAAKWYQKAADQGNWSAQDRLGEVYEKLYRKTLDERHLRLSLKWYYKSREDNHIIDLGNWKDNIVSKDKDGNVVIDNSNAGPLKMFYNEGVIDAANYSTYEEWEEKVVAKLAVDSDVDVDIPQTGKKNSNIYALIIANENYDYEQYVPYAENDGVVVAKYINQTLGIPENNIHVVIDAGLNKMKRELDWLITNASTQNAKKIILYYSGHGVPAENLSTSYLLPVDGYAKNTSTGLDLTDVYEELGKLPSESVVLLDACFSGAKRKGGMLVESRGISIKPKEIQPKGKMIVLSACQGSETAYPIEEQKHGLFTYYLLKKLQTTGGDIEMGTLMDYVTKQVQQQSVVINNKIQTPTVIPSQTLTNSWRNLKLR